MLEQHTINLFGLSIKDLLYVDTHDRESDIDVSLQYAVILQHVANNTWLQSLCTFNVQF